MTPQDGQSPGRRGRSGECRTKSPWSGRSVADQGPCTLGRAAASTLKVVSWVCAWIFSLQRAHFSNPIAQHQTGTAGFVERGA